MRYRPGYTPTAPLPAALRARFEAPTKVRPRLGLRLDALDRAALRVLRGVVTVLLLPLLAVAALLSFLVLRGTIRTLGRWFHGA
jgi:hypothetical protein